MANTYSAFGMKPVGNGLVRTTEYYLPTTDSAAYAIGTPVNLATGSNTNTNINGKISLAGQYKTIVKATGGDTADGGSLLLGSIIGFDSVSFAPYADYSGYRPASQERVAIVADDPQQLFEIQVSGMTAADIGKNANITIAAPNASSKTDGSYLNATFATTATFQVRVIDIKPEIGNEVGASNTQVAIVRINKHALADGSVGV
jgi:hypothetical protein